MYEYYTRYKTICVLYYLVHQYNKVVTSIHDSAENGPALRPNTPKKRIPRSGATFGVNQCS